MLSLPRAMLGYFPTPYPDELFYSLIARYCAIMQFPSHRLILRELFETSNVASLCDLPKGLERFISILPPGHCYTSDVIIDEHTPFRLYAPFLMPQTVDMARNSMKQSGRYPAHLRLGIVSNHVQAPAYLRFCPECVKEDRAKVGESYWHCAHQLPGIAICATHKVFLEDSSIPRLNRTTSNAFITLQAVENGAEPRPVQNNNTDHQLLTCLAEDATWLLRQDAVIVGPEILQRAYLNLTTKQGLTTCNGRMYQREILKRFSKRYSADVLTTLQSTAGEGTEAPWIIRLLWSPRGTQSPVRHLLLINFLGYRAPAFFQELSQLCHYSPNPFGAGPWNCQNPVCTMFGAPSITFVRTAHSRYYGATVGTFACPQCGFSYIQAADSNHGDKSWVKDYGPVWRSELKKMWSNNLLSVSRIAQVLRVDPLTARRQAVKLGCPRLRFDAKPAA